ncbi:ATP-binding cassette domain-containing protein [Phaeobacter sp.]|uniref:ABC transporter ATP-binding protein n=1 Tax=Phaeobacter sp. TaxID=1902409 RepID=UPI0025E444BE|nr:ATP-binding cassette domain-containing protein [Phaeobacter sp.]
MDYALTYQSVGKSFQDGDRIQTIFSDLSFAVPKGTVFAISGRSGVGKSTILNLTAGFDDLDSGEIYLGSEPISAASAARREALRRTEIGFVFQNSHLLPELTALENIALSMHDLPLTSRQKQDWAMELLADFQLEDRAWHRRDQLSGGQRQRVSVARAIAGKKSLLLVDEPTSSLDDENRDRMIQLFLDLRAKHALTILLASHDAQVLEAADQVLSLDCHA